MITTLCQNKKYILLSLSLILRAKCPLSVSSGGGNAEFVTVNEDHVMPVPDWMSFTDAAAIPEVWLTAYQLLHKVGKPHSLHRQKAGGQRARGHHY